MIRARLHVLCPMLLVTAALMHASAALALAFYVDPSGSDHNAGIREAPFATLERARDAVRAWKVQHGLPEGGIQVVIRGGTYPVSATLALDERDSGAEGKPVVYRAQDRETVRLVGGVELPASAFRPVTRPSVIRRLLPDVRGRVMEVDLKALGIRDYGAIGPRGFRRPYVPGPAELCYNGEVMQIARWPNAGQPMAKMGRVLDAGGVMSSDSGLPAARYDSRAGATFVYQTDRPDRWRRAGDVWLTGVFGWGFSDDTVEVAQIDTVRKQISTSGPTFYGFLNHRPFCGWIALNLPEEIDVPGEYCIDRKRGMLYFLPPGPLDGARLQLSMLSGPMVALEGASDVVFERLTLECTRGTGVYIERGARNQLRGCTLRNMGIMGVQLGMGIEPAACYGEEFTGRKVSRQLGSWHEHVWTNNDFNSEAGRQHGIISCDIYNMGAGGVFLSGGDRVKLEPAGNYVENCILHNCGRLDPAYKAAVNFDGVGNRVSHCRISEHPNMAIYLQGNDQVIEYNEITRCAQRVDDMGALYTGMDPTQLGTVIRGNFWHDNESSISDNHPVIYFDCPGGHGATIEGNVFYHNRNAWGDIMLNQGAQGFQVNDNTFIGERRALRLDEWSPEQALGSLFGTSPRAKLLRNIDLSQPPYSVRYPGMANFRQPGWYDTKHNKLMRNLVVDCADFHTGNPDAQGNCVTDRDPGFVDAANMDFGLREGAPVLKQVPGFHPVPFDQIGLRRDEYRTVLPLKPPQIECAAQFLTPGDTVRIRSTQHDPGVDLRYTVDGSEPSRQSARYTGPIPVAAGDTVVRARAFARGSTAESLSVSRCFHAARPVAVTDATPEGWITSRQALRLDDVILDEEGRIGFCENGDYIVYGPYDFGNGGYTEIEAVVGIDPQYANQKTHFRLDGVNGKTVGTFVWRSTGGFRVYGTQRTTVTGLSGKHYLYLVMDGGAGICNLERFRFVGAR